MQLQHCGRADCKLRGLICIQGNLKSVCGSSTRKEFSSVAVHFSWRPCDQAYLCVCLCVHLRRCMCVFIGLSGEPGQSVRCSNGGFKDKRCGEFPGCLLTNPTTTTTTPPSPFPNYSHRWDAEGTERHISRHLDG